MYLEEGGIFSVYFPAVSSVQRTGSDTESISVCAVKAVTCPVADGPGRRRHEVKQGLDVGCENWAQIGKGL